ncbi:AAA family ATPase [Massilia sp. W12]|uniref:ATP-binding protein n=1 Tax=Massilia sp. W12 TaxID=3126507 RepID=UPI0030D26B05
MPAQPPIDATFANRFAQAAPGDTPALPLGIQNFAEIRQGGYLYADKTALLARMFRSGKYFFLSRPRRFGKSLLLDTCKELLEGNQTLFQGLAVEHDWEWRARIPVLKLDMGDFLPGLDGLQAGLLQKLGENAERLGLSWQAPQNPATGLRELILQTRRKFGQRVAVLVDEYDKPMLDTLQDKAQCTAIRDWLSGFYAVIKSADAEVGFALISGVSRFAKVSLFSGLNNLRDITLDPDYASLCGYTEAELDRVFAPWLQGLSREQIKRWYNGYHWLGERVYNPYAILCLLQQRKFKPHWYETGSPGFLLKELAQRTPWLPDLQQIHADADLLSNFDIETISIPALMFQTGYLTIADEYAIGDNYYYRLRLPNRDVELGLFNRLLPDLVGDDARIGAQRNRLHQLLSAGDIAALRELFQSIYAAIPYNWHSNTPLAQYEAYYASVFYVYFMASGFPDVRLEDATSVGRIDMSVILPQCVCIFEFKVVAETADGSALAQIEARNYAQKYKALGRPVFLIGIEFSSAHRNIAGFDWKQV